MCIVLKVCSIENTETDTQASVWADFKGKQLVISFRGTEQVKFKDILTDINLIQVSPKSYFTSFLASYLFLLFSYFISPVFCLCRLPTRRLILYWLKHSCTGQR